MVLRKTKTVILGRVILENAEKLCFSMDDPNEDYILILYFGERLRLDTKEKSIKNTYVVFINNSVNGTIKFDWYVTITDEDENGIRYGDFINELRKAFPLAANRMKENAENYEDQESIFQIDTRNVIDGNAFVKHIKSTGKSKYPFGKKLKKANSLQRKVINAKVNRLLNINSAVADLAISESTHQIVQENYDRIAAIIDLRGKGTFSQFPDVIKTQVSGITLVNRFGMLFQSEIRAGFTDNSLNPRVIAEPVINAFLESILPPLNTVFIQAAIIQSHYYKSRARKNNSIPVYEVKSMEFTYVRKSLEDLGLTPIDLLYVLDIEKEKTLSALDDFMIHQVFEAQIDDNGQLPRADVEININYSEQLFDESGKPLITIFELAPLIKSLKSLILNSRPLEPSDLMLSNEMAIEEDGINNMGEMKGRIVKVITYIGALIYHCSDEASEFKLIKDGFLSLVTIGDLELTSGNKVEINESIDSFLGNYVDLLFKLNHFGLCETNIGDIYNRKAAIFSSVYKTVAVYLKRWEDKILRYDGLMNKQRPIDSSDKEKIKILQSAYRTISTDYLAVDKEMNIAQLKEIVISKKKKFDIKFTEIKAFLKESHQKIKVLFNKFEELKSGDDPLSKYDFEPLEIIDSERQVLIYAEDIAKQLQNLNTVVYKKIVAIEELVGDIKELIENGKISNEAIKLEDLQKAGKILFGEAFKMIPEYKLSDNHKNELMNCYNGQEQLLKYQKEDLQVDFPMDDWLYGLARVREKMGHWENVVILSENFKSKTLELVPFQIPYKINDIWLGLSFPESYSIESEKLLYTAYLNEFKPIESLCGILVDEWIDLIPQKKETTGLAFNEIKDE